MRIALLLIGLLLLAGCEEKKDYLIKGQPLEVHECLLKYADSYCKTKEMRVNTYGGLEWHKTAQFDCTDGVKNFPTNDYCKFTYAELKDCNATLTGCERC